MMNKIDHVRAMNEGCREVPYITYVVTYKSGTTRLYYDCDKPATVKRFLKKNATHENKVAILRPFNEVIIKEN